jgi:hypothetical protein
MAEKQLCFILVLGLSIFFLIYGFMDLMKKGTDSGTEKISRQLKGFAYIMLSQVVLILGGALCLGGVEKSLSSLKGAYPGYAGGM